MKIAHFLNKFKFESLQSFLYSLADFLLNNYIIIKKNKIYYFLNTGKNSRKYLRSFYEKEPDTIDWINNFKPKSLLLDVGANMGVYSLYAAKEKNCDVVAIEPLSQSFSTLNLNIIKNKLSQKITAYPLCVSDRNELNSFFHTNSVIDINGGAFAKPFNVRNIKMNNFFSQGTYSIKTDIFFDAGIYFNYIKCDIDGNELKFLYGAKKTLSSSKIKSLLIELNIDSKDYHKIINFIKQRGFKEKKLSKLTNVSKKNNQIIYNHIFNK